MKTIQLSTSAFRFPTALFQIILDRDAGCFRLNIIRHPLDYFAFISAQPIFCLDLIQLYKSALDTPDSSLAGKCYFYIFDFLFPLLFSASNAVLCLFITQRCMTIAFTFSGLLVLCFFFRRCLQMYASKPGRMHSTTVAGRTR